MLAAAAADVDAELAGQGAQPALFAIDWVELVVPTHSINEMLVRGTLTYLALFLILRFVMKRQTSKIGIADILVVVVIADAAQNAFYGTES